MSKLVIKYGADNTAYYNLATELYVDATTATVTVTKDIVLEAAVKVVSVQFNAWE